MAQRPRQREATVARAHSRFQVSFCFSPGNCLLAFVPTTSGKPNLPCRHCSSALKGLFAHFITDYFNFSLIRDRVRTASSKAQSHVRSLVSDTGADSDTSVSASASASCADSHTPSFQSTAEALLEKIRSASDIVRTRVRTLAAESESTVRESLPSTEAVQEKLRVAADLVRTRVHSAAAMGCSLSGLNALYDAVATKEEVYLNNRRLEVLQVIGEGGYAFVYLVKEVSGSNGDKETKQTYVSRDGTYALKKVVIQTEEQLELVKQEIDACTRFSHPNLLPLLDHSIIPVQKEGRAGKEAYLLFPVFKQGTLQDAIEWITQKEKDSNPRDRYSALKILNIFHQMCLGLAAMHHTSPPYCHNDLKPANVLLGRRSGETLAVLMDFGSTTPALREVRNRTQALTLQEWAAQHCSAPYRAPELWDCPSVADVSQKTDIWSLGCTLYAMMCGQSPFEYSLGETGGSLQLAVMSGQIKWPPEGEDGYPESFRQLVSWMLQVNPTLRPDIDDVITHVEKLLGSLRPTKNGGEEK